VDFKQQKVTPQIFEVNPDFVQTGLKFRRRNFNHPCRKSKLSPHAQPLTFEK
jgi:hypothetical protein